MELTSIVGLGLVAVCIVVLLRQYKPEFALMVSLVCSVVIFAAVLSSLLPALDEIRALMDGTAVDAAYIAVLVKCLGLCFITQIASDSCRDAGESAIASRIEFAGRLSLVAVALPLFQDVVRIALSFINM